MSAYPFPHSRADALGLLADVEYLNTFAAVHASPPCQAYTTMSNRWRGRGGAADAWARTIGHVREALDASGLPYIIENVVGARREMRSPILLRGGMFGLGVDRPRLFESNVEFTPPPLRARVVNPVGVYGKAPDGRRLYTRADGSEQRAASSVAEAAAALGGCGWMSWDGVRECVPPAYTEYLGRELLLHIQGAS